MYITGGVGSRSAGEAFGDPYELPSSQAYAETCASAANVFWNFRMLAVTANSKYADLLERALYNGVNSGMSLSGTLYCYRNPLQSNGEKVRNPWYDTTCCPPNVERLFESLPGYFYATSREGVFVNLFHNSDLDWHLENGTGLKLNQSTSYPWSGDIKLTVVPEHPSQFTVFMRWPNWATSADVQINGTRVEGDFHPGQFIPLTRTWSANDTITVSFPIQTVPTQANPRVADLYGRLALTRGPLVYAMEQIDQGGASLYDLFIRAGTTGNVEVKKDLLGGVTVIHYPGMVAEKALSEEGLYESAAVGFARQKRPVVLTFIPYYAWANREQSPMEVWVPATRSGDTNNPGPNTHAQDRHTEAR
jgi:hypothetical protein